MSRMSELHADLEACRRYADDAAQQPDTASTRAALNRLRDATIRAAETLNFAEDEARDARLRSLKEHA